MPENGLQQENQQTSLKGILQGMAPKEIAIVEGVVVKASPVAIQLTNNPKMVASGQNLIVPRHLTDYRSRISIDQCSSPMLTSKTATEKPHTHSNPEGGRTGEGEAHSHTLDSFKIGLVGCTIHNALAVGDKVSMLSLENGKQYYVLDRG